MPDSTSTGSAAPPLRLVAPDDAAAPTPRTGSASGLRDPRATPAMKQYARFKARFPDCLLLFRMGDFYELFDDDAVVAARALNLTLTERTAGVPMAGVPYHALETYLKRLIEQGFRVAVCEQVEDPKEAKGVVERAVTRVVTPGSLTDEALLEAGAPAAVAAVALAPARRGRGAEKETGRSAGVAVIEPSTGEFAVLRCCVDEIAGALARFGAREAILPQQQAPRSAGAPADAHEAPADETRASIDAALQDAGVVVTPRPAWEFGADAAAETLREQFGVATLDGFDIGAEAELVASAGAVVRYLRETQLADSAAQASQAQARPALAHLSHPKRERAGGRLILDAAALRALEIEAPMRAAGAGEKTDGSLLGLFRGKWACRTAMGQRLLRAWLLAPLTDRSAIAERHRCVACLVEDERLARELNECLGKVQDVARIAGRLGVGRATPRDLVALGASLGQRDRVRLSLAGAPAFQGARSELEALGEALEPLRRRIAQTCVDDPPAHLREGGLIRDSVDAQLDEVRALSRDASTWLAQYQQRLAQEHELPNLKVGFNRVFGYYIELPRAQAQRAPESFNRRQTLKNAERYITPELKAFEEKATTARERAIAREQRLFADLCAASAERALALTRFAQQIASVDALACLARKARARRWVEPEMIDEPALEIEQGRHPALDELLEGDFTPNDLALGTADEPARCALITGPNMAGKSTFIRQCALIALLAQAGSFVPAASARVGVVDRIFTRVGADDALHQGKSTFMVEMTEVAAALNAATDHSLLILDEVGRGTSTLDGLALAWAIAEKLARDDAPRTLFATHYHELTTLADAKPERVRNLHVKAQEIGEEIVFLHRVAPGRSDRSYGVHVARLAGLPADVVARASALLEELSVTREGGPAAPTPAAGDDAQLPLFAAAAGLREEERCALETLRSADLAALSPLEAFDLLRSVCGLLRSAEQPDVGDG